VAYSPLQPSAPHRLVGIAAVVLLHVAIIWGLVNGLARNSIDVIRGPIETRIIDAPTPEKVEPPPPPPTFRAPPPPFVPPPEVNIEMPPAPQSTAPVAITTTRPPPAEPARTLPHIDVRASREPEYPPVSRRLGEQGSLILQVLVGVDGKVRDAKLVQSSGFDRLDRAALDGVKTSYRFVPGTVDGKPQEMWYTFKFNWKLK